METSPTCSSFMIPKDSNDPYEQALFSLGHDQYGDFRQAVSEMSSLAIVDSQLESLLHHSVRMLKSDSTMVLLMWPRGRPDINGRNIRGETPFHVLLDTLDSGKGMITTAIENIVAMLIDSGANVFAADARGRTPVQMVAKIAHCPPNIVRKIYLAVVSVTRNRQELPMILRENGWSIDMTFHIKSNDLIMRMMAVSPEVMSPSHGRKPHELLHLAVQADCQPQILKVLLFSYGLDANARYGSQCSTPLHEAAMANINSSYYKHMSLLLRAHADPNARDNRGLRPIHYVVENGSVKIFQLLLDAGSEGPGDRWPHGLHSASANGHTAIMRHLVTSSNINSVCNVKMTPLHYAARARHPAAVYFLLAMGADLKAADYKGWTVLHHAVHGRDGGSEVDVTPVIGLLLHFGADVEHLDRDKKTPLHVALMRHNRRAVYMLIRHIALHSDPDKPTVNESLIQRDVKNFGMNMLYNRCQFELMQLSECGILEDANYLLLLQFTREKLLGVASGAKEVNFLNYLEEGGIEFVSSTFSPAAFPIYGNFLMSRVHHANIELMTVEEIGGVKDESLIAEVLALSALEFAKFFSADYII